MLVSEPGIYENILIEDYVRDCAPEPSLSTGIAAALLDECPLAAWQKHFKLNPNYHSEDSGATDVGKLAHSMLLKQPGDVVIVPFDDWRKKEAREIRDNARSEGKIPVLEHVYPKVKKMVDVAAIKLMSVLGEEYQRLRIENTIVWKSNGVWCRTRPDIMTHDYSRIIDFKTTNLGANPESAARLITNRHYDLQGALVRKGVEAITGKTPEVLFLILECEEPYLCSMVGLDPAFIGAATTRIERAIDIWAECLKTNNFPGYPDDIAWVEPPPYLLAQAERAFLASIPGGEL